MVTKNAKSDRLGQGKKYSQNDTSYSSIWRYTLDNDMKNPHFKDMFVDFYNDKELLSEFNPTVAKNIISFWSEENDVIFDPFSGRTRLLVAEAMNRQYYGFEISYDVCKYMIEKLQTSGLMEKIASRIDIYNDDCIKAEEYLYSEVADLVLTCPPYWNLEKYESSKGQLSDIKDYDEFMDELVKRLFVASKILKKDKYMCIVIGDFRRDKNYYTLHSDLIQRMNKLPNLKLHDIIIIQNIPWYASAFYAGAVKKSKITAKAHEYLLVYKKQ